MNNPTFERVAVTADVVEVMEAHALEARPDECCGLLAGNGQVISSVYRLANTAGSPRTKYFAAPEDLLAAMRTMRQQGQTMMGIYHSHPDSPAYPSKSDVELAFYSDSIYFIVSLATGEIRAFRINNQEIISVEIVIAR